MMILYAMVLLASGKIGVLPLTEPSIGMSPALCQHMRDVAQENDPTNFYFCADFKEV